ncbi:hypothetical protein ACR2V0_28990, partial [Klebsiella pneumoniae]
KRNFCMRIERWLAIVSGVVGYSFVFLFFHIFLSQDVQCSWGWIFAFIIILKMELISFPWQVALHLGGTEAVSQARVEVCVCICSCSILCEQLIMLLKDAEPMLGAYVAYGWTHLLWIFGAAMGRGLFINLRNLVCCLSGIRIQLGAFSFRSQNEWLSEL